MRQISAIKRLAEVPGHLHLAQWLAPREALVLELARSGATYARIAQELNVSRDVARRLVAQVLTKATSIDFSESDPMALYKRERWGAHGQSFGPGRDPEAFYFVERWCDDYSSPFSDDITALDHRKAAAQRGDFSDQERDLLTTVARRAYGARRRTAGRKPVGAMPSSVPSSKEGGGDKQARLKRDAGVP